MLKGKKRENKHRPVGLRGSWPDQGAERGRDVPFVWEASCVLLFDRKH